MNVGLRKTKHQQYVDDIFNEIDEESRAELLKAFILRNVTPHERGLKISDPIQRAANRVEILDDAESVADALSIAARWWNYAITEEKGFKVIFEEGA